MSFLFVISTLCVVGVMLARPVLRVVAPALARRP
jgi:hypothetical protein